MSPIDSVYILMFSSGLLGGFGHCIGMCGPVVAAYSFHRGATPASRQAGIPHILYNLGRITTYTMLGGIMGLTGSFLTVARSIEKLQGMTMTFIGICMILMGCATAGWLPFMKEKGGAAPLSSFITRTMKSISETGSPGAFFPMGLVMGFIPCGLLYNALIGAAGVGAEAHSRAEGLLHGMLMLFLFGAGTTPALFLLGRIAALQGEWIRSRLYKASAVLMIVMGILFVYRATRL